MAERQHPFPSRTRQLSSPAPMVLRGYPRGRVGRRRILFKALAPETEQGLFSSAMVSGLSRSGIVFGNNLPIIGYSVPRFQRGCRILSLYKQSITGWHSCCTIHGKNLVVPLMVFAAVGCRQRGSIPVVTSIDTSICRCGPENGVLALRPGAGGPPLGPSGAVPAKATVCHPPNFRQDLLGNSKERMRASQAHLHECLYPSGLIVDVFV